MLESQADGHWWHDSHSGNVSVAAVEVRIAVKVSLLNAWHVNAGMMYALLTALLLAKIAHMPCMTQFGGHIGWAHMPLKCNTRCYVVKARLSLVIRPLPWLCVYLQVLKRLSATADHIITCS